MNIHEEINQVQASDGGTRGGTRDGTHQVANGVWREHHQGRGCAPCHSCGGGSLPSGQAGSILPCGHPQSGNQAEVVCSGKVVSLCAHTLRFVAKDGPPEDQHQSS